MNEKQLARYLRAVRRRLPLSGQMKDRVMDDLRSSINERREAGQTDAEIFAALGPAKQAAAELTAQLPGYAFRKSPLRFVCLGAALLALLASGGTPAAPGAGAVILFTILSGAGFVNASALLAYSLILAINRPIEMLVTSLNVVGDAVASICVAKSEGLLNEEKFNA